MSLFFYHMGKKELSLGLKHMQQTPLKKPNNFLVTNFMPLVPPGKLEATKKPKESIYAKEKIIAKKYDLAIMEKYKVPNMVTMYAME